MTQRTRTGDDELPQDALAEIVAGRRGRPGNLRLQIPLAALAGLVGWMGVDATNGRAKIEERVAQQAQELAVMKSQQENIRATLVRIEALLEMMRQRLEERRQAERERAR